MQLGLIIRVVAEMLRLSTYTMIGQLFNSSSKATANRLLMFFLGLFRDMKNSILGIFSVREAAQEQAQAA